MTETRSYSGRLPWRFTIVGLLVLLLGSGVGLACYRLTFNWPESLSAAFLTWFVLGLVQKTRRAGSQLGTGIRVAPEVRLGKFIEFVWPLFALGLLGVGLVIETASRLGWTPWYEWEWPLAGAGEILIALSIVCGYALPRQWIVRQSRPRFVVLNWLASGAASLAGVFWLIAMAAELTFLAALVHIACDGVRVTSATEVFGQRVAPPDAPRELFQEFLQSAVPAALLALASGAILIVLGTSWPRQALVRWALFGAWLLVTIPLVVHLRWAYSVAIPQIAPSFVGLFFGASYLQIVLAAGFVVSAAAMLSVRLAREVRPSEDPQPVMPKRFGADCIHERPESIAVALVAAAWMLIAFVLDQVELKSLDWSQWTAVAYKLAPDFVHPLENVAKCAAVLSLGASLWRGLAPARGHPGAFVMHPPRIALVLLMSLVTCAIVPPAIAWLGFTFPFW